MPIDLVPVTFLRGDFYDCSREIYAVRGVVENSSVEEVDWLFFKTRRVSIRVHLNEHQRVAFNNIARMRMHVSRRFMHGLRTCPVSLPPFIQVEIGETSSGRYPVGCEVGITFGYANLRDQYFSATPLIVMRYQVVEPGEPLENEVPAG